MDRERATGLLHDVLRTLTEDDSWPTGIVVSLAVFGSYLRGSLAPGDVDVAVEIDEDDPRWSEHFSTCMVQGGDPYAVIRRALRGRRRGVSFVFGAHHGGYEDIPMRLLWERGESLATARDRVEAIPVDASAGRMARDAMLPCFDGLDRWIPRFVRKEILAVVDAGVLTVDQLVLPDVEDTDIADRWIRSVLAARWGVSSPLRRAAAAALGHIAGVGANPLAVHLHGRTIHVDVPPARCVGFGLRYFDQLLSCLDRHAAVEWLEIVHPTRRDPLVALRIRPVDHGEVVRWRRQHPGGYFV